MGPPPCCSNRCDEMVAWLQHFRLNVSSRLLKGGVERRYLFWDGSKLLQSIAAAHAARGSRVDLGEGIEKKNSGRTGRLLKCVVLQPSWQSIQPPTSWQKKGFNRQIFMISDELFVHKSGTGWFFAAKRWEGTRTTQTLTLKPNVSAHKLQTRKRVIPRMSRDFLWTQQWGFGSVFIF